MPTPAKIHDREDEALEIGKAVCLSKKLAAPLRPDLDVVFAIWICQRIRRQVGMAPADVLFIPASVHAVDHGVLALDLGIGRGLQRFGEGKSLKRSVNKGSAALAVFRALTDDERDILDTVAGAISDADEKGTNIHAITLQDSLYPDGTRRWDHQSLRQQIMCTTLWSVFDDTANAIRADSDLVAFWGRIFDGMLATGLKKKQATEATKHTLYRFNNVLAILEHNAPIQTTQEVYHKGAKVVLFSSFLGADTWTLGLSRKSGDDARFIDFYEERQILLKHVPDIFVHSGGYMAGWTIKSPLVCTGVEFKSKREALIIAIEELVDKALETKG